MPMTHTESEKIIRLTIFHVKIFILMDIRKDYYQLLQDADNKSAFLV